MNQKKMLTWENEIALNTVIEFTNNLKLIISAAAAVRLLLWMGQIHLVFEW